MKSNITQKDISREGENRIEYIPHDYRNVNGKEIKNVIPSKCCEGRVPNLPSYLSNKNIYEVRTMSSILTMRSRKHVVAPSTKYLFRRMVLIWCYITLS